MRYFLGIVGSTGLAASLLTAALTSGCGVGVGADFDTGGSGGGNGNGNGPGATTANGFGTGDGSTGAGSSCTAANCIGNNPQGNCDSGLTLDSSNGMDGAKAIGLCTAYAPGGWGVKAADWVRSDGQPLVGGDGGPFGDGTDLPSGKGILSSFGSAVTPREGSKLLAISSGTARQPSDPGYASVGGDWKDSNPHGAPPGYPKESPSCPGVVTGSPYDSAGLNLIVHTPADAKSLSFNIDFYTYEFPGFICSEYNDFFVAMMNPKPADTPDGNISFDSQGNTISVNAGFLQVCTAQSAGGKQFDCALGTTELNGTGFDEQQPGGSAATSWLETKADVTPDSDITLQFAIWDSGDGVLDSTALIDNFKFEVDGSGGTHTVPQ